MQLEKKIILKNSESALYMKSLSMPLIFFPQSVPNIPLHVLIQSHSFVLPFYIPQ